MAGAASATMEGSLLKRQRGLHQRRHVFTLKFEERFFRLSPTSLEYFKGRQKQKRGQFIVQDIKIVEEVKDGTFAERSLFYFQIGSGTEVMYLAAKTPQERDAWMEALRTVAQRNGNQMLPRYHDGVFSLQKHKWSCCQNPERTSSGCVAATRQSPRASASLTTTYPPPVSIGNRAANWSKESRNIQTAPQALHWESVPHNLSLSLDDSFSASSCESTHSFHSANPSSGDTTQYATVRREISHPQLPLAENYTSFFRSSHPAELTLLCTKPLSKAVSTLAWGANDELFVGSREDCHISVLENLEEPGLSQKKDIKISSGITNVDAWDSYLAVGSAVSQIFSKEKETLLRRTIIAPEDESLKEPSQHLVAFTPTGQLATACVGGNEIKLWPPPSRETTVQPVTVYQNKMIIDTDHAIGSICSLAISPAQEYDQKRGIYPCLAVGISAASDKSNTVLLFDWKTQKHQCILETGRGGSLLAAFSPTGSSIVTGCATSLQVWKPTDGTQLVHKLIDDAFGAQISSLCCSHNGRHLLAGLENGEVKSFELTVSEDTDGCTIKSGFTFNRLEIPSAATSIAYSRDGRLLAVGHDSGILRLWRAHEEDATAASTDTSHTISKAKSGEYDAFSGMIFCNEPLLTRIKKIECCGSEEKYHSTTDGYSIEISKGAFAAGEHVTIQHGVVRYGPFGPFQHHCDLKIVSPIVGFCSNSDLPMPIKITLPHCINSTYSQDLVCLKAKHDACVFENDERMFELKTVQDGEVTRNSNSVTLDINHLCFYCLGIYCRNETTVANFCLIEVMPTHRERKPYQIHYCLCYLLDTCRMAVNEQYSDGFELRVMRVTFPKGEKDPCLKIKFQRNIPGGWTITRRGPSKICAHEVCFWDAKSTKELVQVHEDRAYPPRFTLEVDGRRATAEGFAEVEFEGINEDRSTEIPLRLPIGETQTTPAQAHFERPTEESSIQQSPSHTTSTAEVGDHTDVESSLYSQRFDNLHLRLPAVSQHFSSLAEPVRNGAIPGAT